MVLLGEIAIIRLTKDQKLPFMELLIKVTEQEELIHKLQEQLKDRKGEKRRGVIK